MENLWNFSEPEETYAFPDEILSEQGARLDKLTDGLVTGKVEEITFEGHVEFQFNYNFNIETPFMPNYTLALLRIGYDIPVYPVHVFLHEEIRKELKYPSDKQRCENAAEFKELLRASFCSKYTNMVLGTLVKMSKNRRPY